MNYFPHHIGDYAKDTAHLSMTEDGAYRRLMDLCYATERPLPADKKAVYRLSRAMSKLEQRAVDTVLQEFFKLESDGWHQKRIDLEIERAQEKSKKAKDSAGKRWHSEGNANASAEAYQECETLASEGNAPNNQEPITKNQSKDKPSPTGSRLALSELPEEWKDWATTEKPGLDPAAMWPEFRDYWTAKAGKDGRKADWFATWRNWCRKPWNGGGSAPDYSSLTKEP